MMRYPDSSSAASNAWRALQLFNIYRILVALLFIGLLLSNLRSRYLGHTYPRLYAFDLLGYLLVAIFALFTARLRSPPFAIQAGALAALDITFVFLLLHSSGGLASGLGVLLIPPVAAVGVLMPGIWALFAAAVASLLLIGDQTLLFWQGVADDRAYASAGFLGLALFATAIISQYLGNRARAGEALATRRGIDLANLTELSEYVIDHLQSGLIVIDLQGRLHLINQRAKALLGLGTPPESRYLGRISPPLMDLARAWRRQTTGHAPTLRLEGREKDLRVEFAALPGDSGAVIITLHDQAELVARIQTAKLASLGRLGASIAHEIRNPLSSISHAAQLLQESASLDPSDRRLLDIIRAQSDRIDRIIADVLRLARKEPPATATLDLARWLPARADILKLYAGSDALVRIHAHDSPLRVSFDENQLEQILAGLCENAAVHGRSADGRLEISLEVRRDAESGAIVLDVCDKGPGIAREHLEHLFEPFFTTSVSGTGLGLYLARELCLINGAEIIYVPTPGGACFRLRFLPAEGSL